MKFEITGWISNGIEVGDVIRVDESTELREIKLNSPVWAHRGKKKSWGKWPPKRIKITVEDMP